MSAKEYAIQLLNEIPEFKIECVIAYMQGIIAGYKADEPNEETLEAIKELENGKGEHFSGSTEDLFNTILEG